MIVITAATGQIGSRVVQRLVGADAEVRAVVRDATSLPTEVRERVDVVEGSHADPEVVDRALAGADALFWLVPADPTSSSVYSAYLDFTIPAADAVVRHGVPRVVTVSALGRGVQVHAGHASASFAMEDLLRSTGAHVRALAMPSFMDNLLWQVGAIKGTGAFYSGITPDLRLPTVATRDVAEVAARLLLDDGWTGQDTLPVLGAEDLSAAEMAAVMSDVLGTPVAYRQTTPDAYRDGFVERGHSPAMAEAMLDMLLAKDAGLDTAVSRTPDNSTPTTFRAWCEDTLLPAFRR